MIGRLTGVILEKQAPYLLVDVQGVGYELQAPMTTFFQLPEIGTKVVLHTHLSISENAHQLFGFISESDRQLFRLLIKVSSVGPKMAVGIMSMESSDFVRCVMGNNLVSLVKIPGVGKKTAERLVVELRDKLKDWSIPSAHAAKGSLDLVSATPSSHSMIEEAESALISLGYKPAEAAKAISAAMSDEITRSEQLIRLALRNMLPS